MNKNKEYYSEYKIFCHHIKQNKLEVVSMGTCYYPPNLTEKEIIQEQTRGRVICEWENANTLEQFAVWKTKCDNTHEFISGTPTRNRYVYCPYCGGIIKEAL